MFGEKMLISNMIAKRSISTTVFHISSVNYYLLSNSKLFTNLLTNVQLDHYI